MKGLEHIQKYLNKTMSEMNPDYQNDTLENRIGYLILAIEQNDKLKEVVKNNYLINASEIFLKLIARKKDNFIIDEVLLHSNTHIEALGYKTNYSELIKKQKEVLKGKHNVYKGNRNGNEKYLWRIT